MPSFPHRLTICIFGCEKYGKGYVLALNDNECFITDFRKFSISLSNYLQLNGTLLLSDVGILHEKNRKAKQ